MPNCKVLLLALAAVLSVCSCSTEEPAEWIGAAPESSETGGSTTHQPEEKVTINLYIGDEVFRADIETGETGRAFLAKLPLTLDMSELNGSEKYCSGIPLPHEDQLFDTITAGDLMLYAGNCIVLFYGPAGGFSYTRIGRLQSTAGLAAALGPGSVRVTFVQE